MLTSNPPVPAPPRAAAGRHYRGKRALDLALLGLAAVPAALLGALIAVAILLDDGPPVFFRHERVGHSGRPFVLLKFRTMRVAAQPHGPIPDPAMFTRAGRLLRRLSLDELPQLINIARAEMSVVGPRPVPPYQVRRYTRRQCGRLAVRPGLTGLAQVRGRNQTSWSDRIECDLDYIRRQSFWLDLGILARTAPAVLTGDGVDGHAADDPISQADGGTQPMPELAPHIRLAKPDLGEEEVKAVREVFASGILTGGPQNAAFEREFAARHKVAHAVTFANGTVALAAMLLAEGIGPGDEVIVPSMTFIATATAVRHVGATPVFADIDPDTFTLDPVVIPALVTSRTRAVLTVHYAGQPAALDPLLKVCSNHGIALLEDAAQAVGGSYRGRPAGSFGRSAMFSFTPTKNITTGEGGIVVTGEDAVADRLRLLRNHGQTRLYEHEILGYNWRLTEMQAAIGRVQLRKLDGILARKRASAAWMNNRLAQVPGITPPYVAPHSRPTHMLYTVLVDGDRDAVLARLLANGIEARIYFPPVHRQWVFADLAGLGGPLPVTEDVAARMLSVPMHAQLTRAELGEIADCLEAAVQETRLAAPGGQQAGGPGRPGQPASADRQCSTRLGTPATVTPAGWSRITTAPAPTMVPAPTRRFCRMQEFVPKVTSSPTVTAPAMLTFIRKVA